MKWLIGSFLGVIFGPGILGFLSELATYRFAINYGIRPPLEGIPYLRATVTFGGIFITVIAAIVFLLTLRFASNAATRVAGIVRDVEFFQNRLFPEGISGIPSIEETLQRFRKLPITSIFALAFTTGILMAGLVSLIDGYMGEASFKQAPLPEIFYYSIFGLWAMIFVFVAWNRITIWYIAAASTFLSYMGVLILMFTPSHYASFLRFLGYGGGLPVAIELDTLQQTDSGFSVSNSQAYEGYLLLRTTDSLILYDAESAEVLEFPVSKVLSVRHKAEPLTQLDYKLPK